MRRRLRPLPKLPYPRWPPLCIVKPSPKLIYRDVGGEMSILPYCMMPDGGDPCKGYAALNAERDRLRAALQEIIDLPELQITGLKRPFEIARRALEEK